MMSSRATMWTSLAAMYVVAGAATIALPVADDIRTGETSFYRDIAASLRTVRGWLLTLVVVPLALAFLLIAWPVFIYDYLRTRNRPSRWSDAMDFEEAHHLCRPEDLVAKLTTEQAEWQGRVPADADVPARPFGHLHGGWRAFVDARPPAAELWSFDRRGRGNTHAEGFAFVEDGKVLCEFAYRAGDRWDSA